VAENLLLFVVLARWPSVVLQAVAPNTAVLAPDNMTDGLPLPMLRMM
jgi:hypothetical protein